MSEVFRFAALGLGAGGLYTLAAIGLVLIYRGSGVVNFAQAAMGLIGAYVYFEIRNEHGLSTPLAIVCGLAISALIGAAMHLLVMRRMRDASVLSKIVATIALLVALQSVAILRYGALPKIVPSMLPTAPLDVLGVPIGRDRIWIFGIVLVLTTALWAIYKYTRFGVATTAVAENPRAAAALAVSPDFVATVNWAIGGALGALAAILLVPITGLGATNLTLLVIPVLAAAVIGRFSSFPITMLAGCAIGIGQAEVTRYVTQPGWGTALPFILVAVVLLLRGRTVAGKDEHFGRMPSLGNGRIAPGLILVGVVAALAGIWWLFPANWLSGLQVQLLFIIILMSFVVVTGFAGQVSLAQMTFAGLGALAAGFLVTNWGWTFEISLVVGALAVIPVGLIVGLIGMRTRGVNLAILTLGLAVSVEAVIFGNTAIISNILGVTQEDVTLGSRIDPTIFGWHINGLAHPERYATVSLAIVVLVGLAVANLRRGRAGRRLIAVRTNERAAAALGVSVLGAKMYAFVLGGVIAAIGGILLAFQFNTITFAPFGSLQSLLLMQEAVLGGVGRLGGPLLGSTFQPGTLGQNIFSFLGGDVVIYLALGGAFILLGILARYPDGLIFLVEKYNAPALQQLRSRLPRRERTIDLAIAEGEAPHVAVAKVLATEDLVVRFGGSVALNGLTMEVRPGEVVGLIGPNGAGKSTAIDAITGFVTPASGSITLDGQAVGGWTRERRARAGLGRSFQSLELFDDLTVLENIQAASDPRDKIAYVTDLVAPGHGELTPAARAAVREFGLTGDLQEKVQDLSYAQRRMLAVARTVAGGRSILLLDEPASGLDEVQTRRLGESIRRLASDQGFGVLLVEHNVDLVLRTCDRVYALSFGETIGHGTPAEIRANPAVIDAYLGTSKFRGTDADEQTEAVIDVVQADATEADRVTH
jgi:sulfate-transporting ATPase